MRIRSLRNPLAALVCSIFILLLVASSTPAQEKPTSKDVEFYNQIKAFSLTGGAIEVKGVVLKRVRTQITLDGMVYLSQPVNGVTTGAVFIGEGKFLAETPTNDFERDNVKGTKCSLVGTGKGFGSFYVACVG